jgi:hypothetical protein
MQVPKNYAKNTDSFTGLGLQDTIQLHHRYRFQKQPLEHT